MGWGDRHWRRVRRQAETRVQGRWDVKGPMQEMHVPTKKEATAVLWSLG